MPATAIAASAGLTEATYRKADPEGRDLFRLGQWPVTGIVPDFVASQPTPCRLDGEYAGEPSRVPAARGPRGTLPPQAERLALEQMRTMFERRNDPRFRRHSGIARQESSFHVVDVVSGFESVSQQNRAAGAVHADSVFGVATGVVLFNHRNFDRQQPTFSGFAIEQTHSSGQRS